MNCNRLTFQTIQTNSILDLLKPCETNNAVTIDNLSNRFSKDGDDVSTIPMAKICNRSTKYLISERLQISKA